MTDTSPNLPADARFDKHLQRVLGSARLSTEQHQRLRRRLRASAPSRPAAVSRPPGVPQTPDTSPATLVLPASDAALDDAGGRSRLGAVAAFLGASLAFAVVATILVLTFRGDGDTDEQLAASPIATAIASPSPTMTVEPSATVPAAGVPTLEEIYTRAGETLTDAGMIYHATIQTTGAENSFIRGQLMGRWVDVNQDVVREDAVQQLFFEATETTFDITSIVAAGSRHTLYRKPEQRLDETSSQTCYGATEAVTAVLGCPGFLEDSTTTVEWGMHDGQATIVLVTIGTARGSDEVFTFTTTLFLDPATYLPIYGETEGVHSYGPVKTETTYQHEFVPIDSLPANFFDPASLATEGLDVTAPDSVIYWLRERLDPDGDLPPLVVSTVEFSGRGDLGFDTSISYSLDGEPGVEWAVAMMEWSRAWWDDGVGAAVRDHWDSKPCHERIEVELENGQATIYMGYGDTFLPSDGFYAPSPESTRTPCTGEPFTRFEAVVEYKETAVMIHAQPGSIYRSAEGIEAILRGLQPHRPE